MMKLNSLKPIETPSSLEMADFIVIRPVKSISQPMISVAAKIHLIQALLTRTLWYMLMITLLTKVITHFGMLVLLESFMPMCDTIGRAVTGSQSTSFGYVGLDDRKSQIPKLVNPLTSLGWIGSGS
jgi:hypothetical protein